MQISPKFAAFAAAPFTLLCLGVAVNGMFSLGEITEEAQLSAARGFIGFWLFLALISVASGAGCWWLMKRQQAQDAA
jgi:hypothetical protein